MRYPKSMLLIWDYFGVIASTPYWDDTDTWAERSGVYDDLRAVQQASDEGKISWDQYCQKVAMMRGVDVQEVLAGYRKHSINQDVVRAVHTLNKHRHVVLSNASHGYLLPIMHELGLSELFEQVFVSSQIGFAKPDPRAYKYVLDQMSTKPEDAVMIDDICANVEAAKALGMQGLVFSGSLDSLGG